MKIIMAGNSNSKLGTFTCASEMEYHMGIDNQFLLQ